MHQAKSFGAHKWLRWITSSDMFGFPIPNHEHSAVLLVSESGRRSTIASDESTRSGSLARGRRPMTSSGPMVSDNI